MKPLLTITTPITDEVLNAKFRKKKPDLDTEDWQGLAAVKTPRP